MNPLDDLIDWRGTAADLAGRANELLPSVGLRAEAGTVNERLVRYYVSAKVLSPPTREGREAWFSFRQLMELLVARHLLHEGWPLAKIGELLHSADISGLQQLLPPLHAGSATDAARDGMADLPPRTGHFEEPAAAALAEPPLDLTAATQPAAVAPRRALPPRPAGAGVPGMAALERAAGLSARRANLRQQLLQLGNVEGRARRRHVVRIDLASWCQVLVDAAALRALDEAAAGALGTALTLALQEEGARRGEMP